MTISKESEGAVRPHRDGSSQERKAEVGPEPSLLAARLRAARRERLLDQGELGARARMPATSISLFESGKRTPSVDNLTRLADVLMVSVDYLLGRSDDPDAHLSNKASRKNQAEVKNQLEQIESLARETRAWFGTGGNVTTP